MRIVYSLLFDLDGPSGRITQLVVPINSAGQSRNSFTRPGSGRRRIVDLRPGCYLAFKGRLLRIKAVRAYRANEVSEQFLRDRKGYDGYLMPSRGQLDQRTAGPAGAVRRVIADRCCKSQRESMTKDEMRALLSGHRAKFRRWTYAELAERVERDRREHDCLEHVDGIAPDGTEYQMDFQAYWDDTPNGDLRVCGSLSAEPQRRLLGFLPIFMPDVTDSFIMSPEGRFVDEEEARPG